MTRLPLVLIAVILGCREPSSPSNAPSAPLPTESPILSALKATPAPESEPSLEPVPTSVTEPTKAAEGLSDDEMVALLIDSRFQHATTEASKKALASAGEMKQSRPVETALEVRLPEPKKALADGED